MFNRNIPRSSLIHNSSRLHFKKFFSFSEFFFWWYLVCGYCQNISQSNSVVLHMSVFSFIKLLMWKVFSFFAELDWIWVDWFFDFFFFSELRIYHCGRDLDSAMLCPWLFCHSNERCTQRQFTKIRIRIHICFEFGWPATQKFFHKTSYNVFFLLSWPIGFLIFTPNSSNECS